MFVCDHLIFSVVSSFALRGGFAFSVWLFVVYLIFYDLIYPSETSALILSTLWLYDGSTYLIDYGKICVFVKYLP